MEAIVTSGIRKTSSVVGSLISLALVFGGSSAFAERLTGSTSPSDAAMGLFDTFSDSDIASLERAAGAEANAARLALIADGAATVRQPESAGRPAAAATLADFGSDDVFPVSGRVLPLVVAVPDAPAVRATNALRPGLVRPVGVSVSSLRSPTPAERSAR